MTELDLIASLRPEVPLPDDDDLAPARSRLMTTLAFEPGGAAAQAPPLLPPQAWPARRSVAPRRRRRMVFGAVAAAGVAVACAATLVVSAGSGSGHALARSQGRSVPATLTAVQFLTAAAAATRHERAGSPPAPDQYVYTETVTPGNGRAREWLSADGSRTGVLDFLGPQASSSSVPACTAAQAAATGCYPAAGYLSGLPVSASAIPAYLAQLQLAAAAPPTGQDTPNWLANDTGKAVAGLLQSTYLLPAQQSALFQLLAQTPGFQIVRDAADVLGRRGVGIYWLYQGSGAMMVFDPATYRFLGFGTWGQGDVPANGQIPPASGGVVAAPEGTALVAMAIVDSEPTVAPSDTQKLTAELRSVLHQAELWAARQPGHQTQTIGALVADYLREVLHKSPTQVQQYMREFAQLSPFLCVRDTPQSLGTARRRGMPPCPAA
jgi:hypothetical protein